MTGVAFSPAGDQVVSCRLQPHPLPRERGNEIKQWDAATGREIRTFYHKPRLVRRLGGVQPRRHVGIVTFAVLGRLPGLGRERMGSRSRRSTGSGGPEAGRGVQPRGRSGRGRESGARDQPLGPGRAAGRCSISAATPRGSTTWPSARTGAASPRPATTGRSGSGTRRPAARSPCFRGHTVDRRLRGLQPRRTAAGLLRRRRAPSRSGTSMRRRRSCP